MRFGRLIVATLVVVAIAAGGFYALAPGVNGQQAFWLEDKAAMELLGGGESRIGVSIRDVDRADVSREQLAAPSGAVIEDVQSDTPASKAGLKAGDVVVTFDGERVRSARQLERLIEETPGGRSVKMTVIRAASQVDLDITPEASRMAWHDGELMRDRIEAKVLKSLPAMEFKRDGPGDWGAGAWLGRGRLGVQVQSLSEDSDQLAGYFGVKSGVLVTHVDESSPAAKAGVKAGDVITAVNGQNVRDAQDLRREIARLDEGKPADLNVTRDKRAMSLKVELEPVAKKTRVFRRTV
jgi:serine protease Do